MWNYYPDRAANIHLNLQINWLNLLVDRAGAYGGWTDDTEVSSA